MVGRLLSKGKVGNYYEKDYVIRSSMFLNVIVNRLWKTK